MPKKYLNTYKLMIGDWVCVYSNDRTETHPFRVNEIVERGVYDSYKGFVEEKDIEPIPLTPEVLEKNGFKLKEWGSHKQYQLTYNIECEDVGYTIVIGGKTTTLDVWWTDYATWLEKKLEVEKRYMKITDPTH